MPENGVKVEEDLKKDKTTEFSHFLQYSMVFQYYPDTKNGRVETDK